MAEIWNGGGGAYPSIDRDIKCTAAVVGGGLTGVLLAYFLGERGIDTVLFEAGRLASGKTGLSTAKVTLAHELTYSELSKRISADISQKYAAANIAGFEKLGKFLSDDARRDMYLYALYGERRLKREYGAMRDCGIACEYVDGADCPLPFEVEGAVRLRDQYAADPVRLVHDIARRGHFRIYENSPAVHIERHGFESLGHTVRAEFVAVCTNYPVHITGSLSPLKLSRKYSAAAVFESDSGFSMPDAMAFGVDGGYGYRFSGGRLIISGETGRRVPPGAEKRLAEAAKKLAPDARLVESWVNNDTYTHDMIPYAGKVRGGVYIACGYSAWGMTNSAASAVILENKISGHDLWYDDIFSPSRNFMRGGAADFAEHMSVAAEGVMSAVSSPPDRYVSGVTEGEAAIVNRRGKKVGAYKEPSGEVHLVSLSCPHLGCELSWNPVDRTWDCPCHGSRFSYTGECISNPAERGIGVE